MKWKRLLVVGLFATLWIPSSAIAQEDTEAAMNEAKQLYRRGDYRSAITRLDDVLAAEPARADALYLRGYSRLMLREFDASVEDFASAFEADPAFDPRTIYQRPPPEAAS